MAKSDLHLQEKPLKNQLLKNDGKMPAMAELIEASLNDANPLQDPLPQLQSQADFQLECQLEPQLEPQLEIGRAHV